MIDKTLNELLKEAKQRLNNDENDYYKKEKMKSFTQLGEYDTHPKLQKVQGKHTKVH